MNLNLDFKFNFWVWLTVAVLCSLVWQLYVVVGEWTEKDIELKILLERNSAYTFDYSCDSLYDIKYYNCPTENATRNLTGLFCYGQAICTNSYREKR
jgi:hypothetical protein